MSSPNGSDRERLLRLIDGGTDVVREVQEERLASQEKAEVKLVPVVVAAEPSKQKSPRPVPITAWMKKIDGQTLSLLKLVLAAVVIVLAVFAVTDAIKSTRPVQVLPVPATGPATGAPPVMVEDLSGVGLRLVGVDWSDTPVALLEDLKSGKTYFVKKNERIKNVRVKQIQKDRVLISAHGQDVELR
jgi:hypothetical protein